MILLPRQVFLQGKETTDWQWTWAFQCTWRIYFILYISKLAAKIVYWSLVFILVPTSLLHHNQFFIDCQYGIPLLRALLANQQASFHIITYRASSQMKEMLDFQTGQFLHKEQNEDPQSGFHFKKSYTENSQDSKTSSITKLSYGSLCNINWGRDVNWDGHYDHCPLKLVNPLEFWMNHIDSCLETT